MIDMKDSKNKIAESRERANKLREQMLEEVAKMEAEEKIRKREREEKERIAKETAERLKEEKLRAEEIAQRRKTLRTYDATDEYNEPNFVLQSKITVNGELTEGRIYLAYVDKEEYYYSITTDAGKTKPFLNVNDFIMLSKIGRFNNFIWQLKKKFISKNT